MYSGKVSYSILPTKHNIKNVVLETSNRHLLRYSLTLRQLSFSESYGNIRLLKNHLIDLIESGQILLSFRKTLLSASDSLKSQSSNILRTWTHQCECVVAQRLRRGQQMFCLYTKMWEERALKDFLNRMRQQIARRSKEFMLTAVGVSAYNWENNRIAEDEMKRHVHEIEYMRVLKDNTMICQICKNMNRSGDRKHLHCNCPNRKNVYVPFDDWMVFIEKEDMIVWRRMTESGSYEYKVYGTFNDVTADDFLNVQIDIDYRRTWDTTAITLNIIERDPIPTSHGDIIYWEMAWPKFFANRDYVFKRRYMVDEARKTLLLVSKCTEHPDCPVTTDKHRVSDYWSHMVITPYTKFSEPGLEFGLTYYDNPGVNVPSSVTAWVAYRKMPEFLDKLRQAAHEYYDYCKKHGRDRCCTRPSCDKKPDPCSSDKELNVPQDFTGNFTNNNKKVQESQSEKIPGVDIRTSPIMAADGNKRTYWKYLHPTYYFS